MAIKSRLHEWQSSVNDTWQELMLIRNPTLVDSHQPHQLSAGSNFNDSWWEFLFLWPVMSSHSSSAFMQAVLVLIGPGNENLRKLYAYINRLAPQFSQLTKSTNIWILNLPTSSIVVASWIFCYTIPIAVNITTSFDAFRSVIKLKLFILLIHHLLDSRETCWPPRSRGGQSACFSRVRIVFVRI
jgi:hypothetical protein